MMSARFFPLLYFIVRCKGLISRGAANQNPMDAAIKMGDACSRHFDDLLHIHHDASGTGSGDFSTISKKTS